MASPATTVDDEPYENTKVNNSSVFFIQFIFIIFLLFLTYRIFVIFSLVWRKVCVREKLILIFLLQVSGEFPT